MGFDFAQPDMGFDIPGGFAHTSTSLCVSLR